MRSAGKVKQRRSADFTWRRLGSLNAGVDTLRPTATLTLMGYQASSHCRLSVLDGLASASPARAPWSHVEMLVPTLDSPFVLWSGEVFHFAASRLMHRCAVARAALWT